MFEPPPSKRHTEVLWPVGLTATQMFAVVCKPTDPRPQVRVYRVSYGFTLLRLSAEPAHSTEALKGSSRQGSGPQLGHAP